MAGRSENTPFLRYSTSDDDYEDDYPVKKLPANEYFKRAIKIFSAISSFFSIATCALCIAAYILTETGSFPGYGAWRTTEATRDLAIVCLTTAIVTLPTIFLRLPILITLVTNFTMSIVLFVFSGELFSGKWPETSFCNRWERDSNDNYGRGHFVPATPRCTWELNRLRIFAGISASFGIIIGLLLMFNALLRVVAIYNASTWKSKAFNDFKAWSPNGFQVSFHLKVSRVPTPGAAPAAAPAATPAANTKAAREEEARLIET